MWSRKTIPAVAAALACWSGAYTAAMPTPATADAGTCQPGEQSSPNAELFTTENTVAITDPDASQLNDGLELFELQAEATISQYGATVTGSTLAEGVFWSDESQQTSYERAREFHLCGVDEPTLHTLAEALRRQFNQESVLTFDYLPHNASDATAVTIDVPNIDIASFRAAFLADSAAHSHLRGGSVTTTDHTLILVTDSGDLDIAHRLVDEAGGDWNTATIAYGKREFAE